MKMALENTPDDVMSKYVNEFDNGKVKVEGFDEFESDLFIKNSKPKQEFILESDNGMTVVLDTTLTEELINEGILREIIRSTQVLRKEADFEIDDRIELNITSDDETIKNILESNAQKIISETLAKSFNSKEFVAEIAKDVEIGDSKIVHFELKRI